MKATWWFVLAAVAGLAVGAAWPPPPIPKSQQASGSAGALPTVEALQRLPPGAANQVGKGIRWSGETGEVGGTAGNQGTWKLAGIVRAPAPAALLRLATGKIEDFPEGATLPDGSRLVRVEGDGVTVERDGCRQVHQLHHPLPKDSSGCPAQQ